MSQLLLPAQCGLSKVDNVYWCDALTYLRALPDGYVNCIVTSPPYFGLRDYGVPGQIGLEDTPQAFVRTMVELFREARRVLQDDGTVWVNLGDSYATNVHTGSYGKNSDWHSLNSISGERPSGGLPSKNLLGIPWRVAFGLQDDGWILRSDIIWHKSNPMPESVTDRPTKSHEYVFLFAKQERYWYDADAIRQPITESSEKRYALANSRTGTFSGETGFESVIPTAHENSPQYKAGQGRVQSRGNHVDHLVAPAHPNGRNARTVWTIATEPTPFAHFATFPQKLIEPMILAGCPHKVCAVCGAAWVRQIEVTGGGLGKSWHDHSSDLEMGMSQAPTVGRRLDANGNPYTRQTLGFTPTCDHHAATRPGIVLDCFMGSGTTGLVARRLGRHFLGSELNGSYVQLARERLAVPFTLPMLGMLEAVS